MQIDCEMCPAGMSTLTGGAEQCQVLAAVTGCTGDTFVKTQTYSRLLLTGNFSVIRVFSSLTLRVKMSEPNTNCYSPTHESIGVVTSDSTALVDVLASAANQTAICWSLRPYEQFVESVTGIMVLEYSMQGMKTSLPTLSVGGTASIAIDANFPDGFQLSKLPILQVVISISGDCSSAALAPSGQLALGCGGSTSFNFTSNITTGIASGIDGYGVCWSVNSNGLWESFSLPMTPVLFSIRSTNCTAQSNTLSLFECPTAGSEVFICGKFITIHSEVVFNNKVLDQLPHSLTQATCGTMSGIEIAFDLPEGLNMNMLQVQNSAGAGIIYRSAEVAYVHFDQPRIKRIRGCSGTGDFITRNCARHGNISLTIDGDNFGAEEQSVFIGAYKASVVWLDCASENGYWGKCGMCNGSLRFGDGAIWSRPYPTRNLFSLSACTEEVFGDAIGGQNYGRDRKCQCGYFSHNSVVFNLPAIYELTKTGTERFSLLVIQRGGDMSSDVVEIEYQPCPSNAQAMSATSSECVCRIGFAAVMTQPPAFICVPCPSGSSCFSEGLWLHDLTPQSGYFSDSVGRFFQCSQPELCLGEGNCSAGRTAIDCSKCADGYTESFDNLTCEPCTPSSPYFLVFAFLIIIPLLGLYVFRSRKNVQKQYENKQENLSGVLHKVIISGVQMNAVASMSRFAFGPVLSTTLNAQHTVTSMGSSHFSSSCFLNQNYQESPSYYVRNMIFLILPISIPLIAVVNLGFYTLYRCRKEMTLLTKAEIQQILINFLVVIFFLLHPTLVEAVIIGFKCIQVGEGRFLEADHTVICLGSKHLDSVRNFTIPSLLLWVIGAPSLALLVLVRNKNKLGELGCMLKYGFLYSGYKRERYWWEFVTTLRKIAMVGCTVFISDVVKSSMLMLIVTIALFIHAKLEPFSDMRIQNFESLSLFTCYLQLFAGWVSMSTNFLEDVENYKNFTEILAMGFLVVFFAVAVILEVQFLQDKIRTAFKHTTERTTNFKRESESRPSVSIVTAIKVMPDRQFQPKPSFESSRTLGDFSLPHTPQSNERAALSTGRPSGFTMA